MTTVNFGMLQQIKTRDLKNNPKLQQIQSEIQNQTDIYTQAKLDYEKASANNDNGNAQPQAMAFSTPSFSVEELEDKMIDAQEKLEKLQATLAQEIKTDNNQNTPEEKDEKNKVKSKSFAGLMA